MLCLWSMRMESTAIQTFGTFNEEGGSDGMFPKLESIDKTPRAGVGFKAGEIVDKIPPSATYDWREPSSLSSTHIVNDFTSTGWIGYLNLDMILSEAIEADASDVHITADLNIYFSIRGVTVAQPKYGIASSDTMFQLRQSLMTNVQLNDYARDLNMQFAYKIFFGPYQDRRFRVSIGKANSADFLVFRVISDKIKTISEIKLEDEIYNWTKSSSGLVLVCGSTGSGKSTTLAAMLREIQLKQFIKLITIENPIEHIYPSDGKALVVQREVGSDVHSFADGIDSAMRQAPDMILLGEVRTANEVSELIKSSESGHVSFSTMHTKSAATTVNRILSLYDGAERGRILSTLSDTLLGITNQVLVRSPDGKKRIAIREILSNNAEISSYIMNGDVRAIRNYQNEREITMEWNLARAHLAGLCTIEEARYHSPYPFEFEFALQELIKR